MKERVIKIWQGYPEAMSKDSGAVEPKIKQVPAAAKYEPYYSIAEAAKMLRISRRWIDNAVNSGKLRFYTLGAKARKVKLSEITRLIENQCSTLR